MSRPGKMVRVDPRTLARLERVRQEINRRAGSEAEGLEFALTAVHRSMLISRQSLILMNTPMPVVIITSLAQKMRLSTTFQN